MPDFQLLPVVQRQTYESGVPSLSSLVQIQAEVKNSLLRKHPAQYLERDAAMAWCRMFRAAAAEGVTLWAYSAWRSHEHQQRIYDEWKAGKRKLRPNNPGWSKHENGRAVDILRSHDDPDAGGPKVGPTDKWLKANAKLFGFFRTVPAELWHWEYLGELPDDEHGMIEA
jgi:LAS superfamily LD-carboxypeptidase LdcB